MKIKMSRNLCLQHSDLDRMVKFYRDAMGFAVVNADENGIEFDTEPVRLYLDKGKFAGPIMEFLVPDVEAAKTELLKHGCVAVRWEGKGGYCYMRDPGGFMFNLYEAPDAFRE